MFSGDDKKNNTETNCETHADEPEHAGALTADCAVLERGEMFQF